MMRRILIIASIVMVTVALSACSNTFNGAGRDVENMGEWVQDTF